jgi:hypothetical protein
MASAAFVKPRGSPPPPFRDRGEIELERRYA